jgi:hypothetical protein
VAGTLSQKSNANIGTPQGDALSPILFIIYLDAALKEYWEEYGMPDTPHYQYCMYADDTDFISTLYADHFFTKIYLPDILKKWNLQMNLGKTEHTKLTKQTVHTNITKKLGTQMSDQQDVTYRRGQATQAFGLMNKLWLSKKHITPKSKIRMYNACIKPILTYNTSCMATTQAVMEKMNSIHRKHLRHLLNIFYPVHITNTELYRVTKQQTISIQLTEARWKLFGHILRQNSDTITNEIMFKYFENQQEDKIKTTKLPNSLPVQLNRDLKSINERLTLQNSKDLQHLKKIAQDRDTWKILTSKIVKKATQTEDAKFETKRKRKESTRINYTHQGVSRSVTFILRRPDNQDLQLDNNIGQQIKRRNVLEGPQPNQETNTPELQRNRALGVDSVDVYQHRSI